MLSNLNIHGIPISLNKNVDFRMAELKKVIYQLNYAFETDFDFNIIVSHYECINIMTTLTTREIGGFYDASLTGCDECYVKVSFYHRGRGQSSNYHIFMTKERDGERFYYKGFSKINPSFATIRNKTKTSKYY